MHCSKLVGNTDETCSEMKQLLFVGFVCLLISCNDGKSKGMEESAFQKELNSEFKDASRSPLIESDLKVFKGLDFFPIDSIYVVEAQFSRTIDSDWFDMPTTRERIDKYRVYGILDFEISGEAFSLEVYQSEKLMSTEEYANHLFLPFLDDTNGEESYGGGRYMDLEIPLSQVVVLDFNKAYNPYCAYNSEYSCPLVPIQNTLDISINAGVKSFKKE